MLADRKWLIVGISGVTCGGKTTLTDTLRRYLLDDASKLIDDSVVGAVKVGKIRTIHQDVYFLAENDPRHKRIAELNHNNWEVPTALDMSRMLDDIYSILMHEDEMSLADNVATFANGPKIIDILLIEGFVIFNDSTLLSLCKLKFHLHIPYEKCFERRRRRTYEPPDVLGYFERCVWPMYMQHFAEFKDRADVRVLNAELPTERSCQFILDALRQLLLTIARDDDD